MVRACNKLENSGDVINLLNQMKDTSRASNIRKKIISSYRKEKTTCDTGLTKS